MRLILRSAWILLLILMGACSSLPAGQSCAHNIVITGYWPPTNEMLRPWSTDVRQNPAGWQGRNWRASGYDVYAFFPEFPPDGDPTNDQIGEPGSVGAASTNLQVDYQATSRDFWHIVDTYTPRLLITTSRGGDIGWELEAREGGHAGSSDDPADDWISDRHGTVHLPTRDSIDPRSWDAITQYRHRFLPSQLPLQKILQATSRHSNTLVAIDSQGTSGNYLSGFMGLHGLYYQTQAPQLVSAGHIHVGKQVSSAAARQLLEVTLATVIDAYPALPCSVAAD